MTIASHQLTCKPRNEKVHAMPHDVNPDVRRILDELDALAGSGPSDAWLTPDSARQWYAMLLQIMRGQVVLPHLASVSDAVVETADSSVPVRTYLPDSAGEEPSRVVVSIHGGGWTVGDLDSGDFLARALAHGLNAAVLSVDYRLAPEHPFPYAFDDCASVVRHARRRYPHALIAVAGDSAGGNLAAAIAATGRVDSGLAVDAQLLIYPALDPAQRHPSYERFATGYLLTRADMRYYWDSYLQDQSAESDPRAAPAAIEDLTGMPPAVIVTAGFDPLRDEGRDYAQRLVAAGVTTIYLHAAELIHGFVDMAGRVPTAARAVRQFIAALDVMMPIAQQPVETGKGLAPGDRDDVTASTTVAR